jgi:hypothetical protein
LNRDFNMAPTSVHNHSLSLLRRTHQLILSQHAWFGTPFPQVHAAWGNSVERNSVQKAGLDGTGKTGKLCMSWRSWQRPCVPLLV